MWVARGVWYFFLVPGGLLLSGAVYNGYKVWDAERAIAYAQGTVTRTSAAGKLGLDFHAEIQFATPDGRSHAFDSTGGSVNALKAGRKVTVVADVIQHHVQLDGAFGSLVVRPIEHRQAERDHAGIQRQQFVFETELACVGCGFALTALQELVEHGFKHLPGPVLVGIAQRGALGRFIHARMLSLPSLAAVLR